MFGASGLPELESLLEVLDDSVCYSGDFLSGHGPIGAGAHVSTAHGSVRHRLGGSGAIHRCLYLGTRFQQFHMVRSPH